MFPVVSDFNFVVGGLATFAATVGYVCSKRLVRRNSNDTFYSAGSNSFSDSTTDNDTDATADEDTPMLTEPSVTLTEETSAVEVMRKKGFAADVMHCATVDMSPNGPSDVSQLIPEANTVEVKPAVADLPLSSQPLLHSQPIVSEPLPNVNPEPVIVLPIPPPIVASPEGPALPERRQSLKRKRMHDHDENNNDLEYPYNLTAIYPNKRRTPPREVRTPERDQGRSEDRSITSAPLESPVVPPGLNDIPNVSVEMKTEIAPVNPPPSAGQTDEPEALEPKPLEPQSAVASDFSVQVQESPKPKPQLPLPKASSKPIFTSARSSPFSTPASSPKPSTSNLSANAFSAFASSTSPFSSFAASSSSSTGTHSRSRPAWSTSGSFRYRNAFSDEPHSGEPDETESDPLGGKSHAIEEKEEVTSSKYDHQTGEEEETVECELKGVKLFVKRGTKEYSSGMLGHVKLLSSKNRDVKRLLFRREPLWKVSMNARLQCTVRCSYDSEESILRVVTPEFLETSPVSLADSQEDSKTQLDGKSPEIVVYAMKPGRFCSKQEFGDFAKSVLTKTSLKG